MINKFDDIIEFFEKSDNLEKDSSLFTAENYKIERIKSFLARCGNLDKKFKVIHTAGSKGKGTVSSMIAAILSSSCKKCALFLSPHVYDYRERFSLAGKFFSDIEYIEAARELEGYVKKHSDISKGLTTFEKYLAFAMILFSRTKCDYAVLETGLGGRLDATNAIDSDIEVFTTIELEHTNILGSTLEKIAIEKSKIIKPYSLVFALDNDDIVNRVLKKEAESMNAKIYFAKEEIKSLESTKKDDKANITLELKNNHKYSYTIPLTPDVFVKDSALSILTLDYAGLINPESSLEMLCDMNMPARFQIIKKDGFNVVLDGAHTPRSVEGVLKDFTSTYTKKRTLVFGCAKDKDDKSMASLLAGHFDKIIILKPGDFKKSEPEKIYSHFEDVLKSIKNEKTKLIMARGAEYAAEMIKKDKHDTLITGSFYLAELMLRAL